MATFENVSELGNAVVDATTAAVSRISNSSLVSQTPIVRRATTLSPGHAAILEMHANSQSNALIYIAGCENLKLYNIRKPKLLKYLPHLMFFLICLCSGVFGVTCFTPVEQVVLGLYVFSMSIIVIRYIRTERYEARLTRLFHSLMQRDRFFRLSRRRSSLPKCVPTPNLVDNDDLPLSPTMPLPEIHLTLECESKL